MIDTRIPVTIITGFLGSGKTTLLNNLIKKHTDKKFAIIENEFGKIGIDSGLIVGADENIYELNNGCICCSLNSDFYRVIDNLLNSEFAFNHLLIETTGIADPMSIINAFVDGGGIQENFKIDSVVCLVDAENIEELIEEHDEIYKQISLSDVIIINKIDTIGKDYLEKLSKKIIEKNSLATIFKVKYADIQDIKILDTNAYSAEHIEQSTKMYNQLQSNKIDLTLKHHIKTEAFIFNGVFDLQKFSLWIQNFIFFNSNRIIRIKGILAFENHTERFIFHSVLNSYMFDPSKQWGNEKPFSKLIFIGKHIDRDEIEQGLEEIIVKIQNI